MPRKNTGGAIGARVAVLLVGSLLALTACGGGGDDGGGADDPKKPSVGKDAESPAAPDGVDTDKVLGELKGPNGIEVAVHSAVRDAGGFVTVNGTLFNKGEKTFRALEWVSGETAIKSRSSIAGATMVDPEGKKRYLVLRDTDGQCLCTTGITGVKAGETRPVFAQFPAPPKDVKTIEFHVPSMSPARVELSEG
ncbi:hypothetical protein GL263_25680 [Streptomyces durbertensis]|uniref:Secreted protein n=1 Tax=Streptomyces durbertensis TaxID=2448886 RepID=A0ABR6EP66_9ACTN|nr:hypothetical protein [Streptomyces durbertensis]MBB1246913.1 hypothetical protein [Streptomyces durbertensis]